MVAVRRRSGLKGSNLDADSSNNLYTRSEQSNNYVWDTNTLTWVKETQPGGGSGGAVTIADGADVAQGAKADVAWVAGDGTVIALLKKIASGGGGGSGPVTIIDGGDVTLGAIADAAITTDTTGTVNAKLRGLIKMLAAGTAHVTVDAAPTTAVTGTFWQATQPVSGTVAIGAGAAVIGHVIVDSGVITTVSAVTAITNALPAGSNVIGHVIADTGSTTAATQATAANLKALVDINAAQTLATVTTVGTVTTITNVVHVDDNSSSLTVDGAVTATVASTTLTATVNPAGCATVADNRLTVTTSGTAVNFPSVAAKSVAVTAETDNTGIVVVGASTVVAAIATRRGTPLSAGDTAIFAVANINELWLDSTVNTDGVTYTVLV